MFYCLICVEAYPVQILYLVTYYHDALCNLHVSIQYEGIISCRFLTVFNNFLVAVGSHSEVAPLAWFRKRCRALVFLRVTA